MMNGTTYQVSFIGSVYDRVPILQNLTSDELAEEMKTFAKSDVEYSVYHRWRADKKKLEALKNEAVQSGDMTLANTLKKEISALKKLEGDAKNNWALLPYVYITPLRVATLKDSGTNNIEAQTLIVLDVDSGLSRDDVARVLDGYEYILYDSFSCTPERARFRLILFPDRPFQKGEAEALVRRIDAQFPALNQEGDELFALDKCSVSDQQLFFMPKWLKSHPEKPVFIHQKGRQISGSDFTVGAEIQAKIDARIAKKAETDERKHQQALVRFRENPTGVNDAIGYYKNGKPYLNPEGFLEYEGGFIQVKDIQGHVQNVTCPGHPDGNGTEFAHRDEPGGGIRVSCKKCGTIWMKTPSDTPEPGLKLKKKTKKTQSEDPNEPEVVGGLDVKKEWREKSKTQVATLSKVEIVDEYPVVRVDERYLDLNHIALIPPKGIMLVKSPKGTGKTAMLKKLVDVGIENAKRTLLLGHRVYLLKSLSERTGLDYYRDLDDGMLSDGAACCLDSLATRIDPRSDEPYDTVIFDESEQVFRHLASRTMSRVLAKVFAHLIWVVRNAKQIICLDADLSSALTIQVLSEMRGAELATDEVVSIINDYKIGTDRTTRVYLDKYHIIHDILADAAAGEKVFVATNNKGLVNTLGAAIAAIGGVKTLLLTSETSELLEAISFIKNPTEESTKYDVVLASPTLSTGVSIEGNHFTKVYGLFGPRYGTYHDADQALSRVRGCTADAVWIQKRVSAVVLKPEVEIFYDHFEKEKKSRIHLVSEDTTFTEGEKLWTSIVTRLEVVDELGMAYKLRDFMALRKDLGYTISIIAPNAVASQIGKDLHDAFKVSKPNRGPKVFAAAEITTQQYATLVQKRHRTEDEQLQVERYRYKHLLTGVPDGFTVETVTKAIDEDLLRIIGRLRLNLTASDADRREWDLADRLKNVDTYTNADHRVMKEELLSWLGDKAQVDYKALVERHEGVEVPVSTLEAVAAAFAVRAKDFNLYFKARIKEPTAEQNLKAVWEATFGYLGLGLKKKKLGPRGKQTARYFLDVERSDLTLKVFEAERAAQGRAPRVIEPGLLGLAKRLK